MAMDLAIVKKEKSLIESLLMISVIFIFIGSFIYYFLQQEDDFTEAAFKRLAATFTNQVVVVHGQWLMEGKHQKVILVSYQDTKKIIQEITVNKYGWIDSLEANVCQAIWQQATNTELNVLQLPITAIAIQHQNTEGRICRYSLAARLFFDYNSVNGQILPIKRL